MNYHLLILYIKNYFKNLISIIRISIFIIILIIIIEIYFYINNITRDFNVEFRVCLYTLGKQENLYIREFVKHYEKYGVDQIYLYDNNEIKSEKFEEVINDYIEKGIVEIINFREKRGQYIEL